MDNKEIFDVKTVKNQKKSYKFNITDVFLILIITGAASVLIYIVADTGLLFSGEEVSVQYTVEIPLLRNEFLPAINRITRGDKITDSVRGYDIGEIQSVGIFDGMANTEDKITGIFKRVSFPDHSRVLLTVRTKAKYDEPNYYVNGKLIMVGVQIFFRTQHFTGYGNCVSFTPVTDGEE
ncbi:MAG: DUF4330 domain-containing protein [Oscillospiraceae bacterium]|nr:DUF4330 domain-containing protein [Oscillospiraceae bacterium]